MGVHRAEQALGQAGGGGGTGGQYQIWYIFGSRGEMVVLPKVFRRLNISLFIRLADHSPARGVYSTAVQRKPLETVLDRQRSDPGHS